MRAHDGMVLTILALHLALHIGPVETNAKPWDELDRGKVYVIVQGSVESFIRSSCATENVACRLPSAPANRT